MAENGESDLVARIRYLEDRLIGCEAALRVHDRRHAAVYWEDYPKDMADERAEQADGVKPESEGAG